jgi:DNA-binding XRE family transcriptional regulator
MACPQCGSELEKRSEVFVEPFPIDGVNIEVARGHVTCAKCETLLGEAGGRELSLAVAQFLFRLGTGSASAFRYIRRALEYQARDLAKLLEVRPETLSHWETGKRPVDRGAWIALGALLEDCIACRTTIRDGFLAALNPQIPKVTVKLDAPIARVDRPWPADVKRHRWR